MAARKFRIPTESADALRTAATYDGPRVTLTRQLGPDTWRGTKSVLERLGAEYVIGASAFEFEPDQDAEAIVTAALDAGYVMALSAAEGFVATPDGLARETVDEYAHIDPVPGRVLRALEPSYGRGALVRAMLHDDGDGTPPDLSRWLHITAVEPDPRRARYVPASPGVTPVVDTFEVYAANATEAGTRFDRVVMNPPFSVPGRARIWAEHVLKAWKLLAPGGRLVAIVPGNAMTTGGREARVVQDLVAANGGYEALESDAFAPSGIMFRTGRLWLDRPARRFPSSPFPEGYTREHPWIVPTYRADAEPVTVDRLIFTRAAAEVTPVQAIRDSWQDRMRVMRYAGDCAECARPTWEFDDGDNTPLGWLGDAATHALDPDAFDMVGPSMAACFGCGDNGEINAKLLARVRPFWTPAPTTSDDAEGFVSGWATVSA
jgi:hypothetical protein